MLRPAHVRLILLAAVLLLGAGAAAYLLWPRDGGRPGPGPDDPRAGPPPDPRLTFDTPFRNVRPDVAYVGDAACAACHKDICDTFHRHAMGRSAVLPSDPPDGVEQLDAMSHARFTAFDGIEYRVERRAGTMTQTETVKGPDGQPVIVTEAVVAVGIGSGTRGRSYLTARDGALWQSGASWFGHERVWDASPGFGPGRHGRRPVLQECLFCHVSQVKPVPGTVNRYREPFFGRQAHIGCERCHGPGGLHVAEQTDGLDPLDGFDASIVNPKHLPADLREDVCRQCHLKGVTRVLRRGRGWFDYRPGLPLDLFLTAFVKHPALTDLHTSVGQAEQVAVSRCATASGGRFGCTACHDPHRAPAPAEKDGHYRQRCVACHQDKGCTEPAPARQAVNDACTTCHMPRAASANISHTAVTDHRILRRPSRAAGPKGGLPRGEQAAAPDDFPRAPGGDGLAGRLPRGERPMVTMPGYGARGPDEDERARDLAIALSIAARARPDDPTLAAEAVQRLRQSTARFPDDEHAWESMTRVLLAQGEWSEALRAAEAAVAADPTRETALAAAADAALKAHRLDPARDYARRAIAVNPGEPEHRLRLIQGLAEADRWAEAEPEVRAVLAMCPNHALARAHLAVYLHRAGRPREALAELAKVVAMDPRQEAALQTWFDRRVR